MKIKLIFALLMFFAVAFSNEQSESAAVFDLKFKTVTMAQWQNTISSYKGRIVVVDMWATWCSSCLKRFPHMVTMSHDYKDKNVEFVSLLLEDPEEPEAIVAAKKFLVQQKADFQHYFMNENIMTSFDILDLLGIPTVFIYSQEGHLAYRLTDDNPNKQFTESDIKNAIDDLIASH